jgi:hypothetical protein
LLTALTGCGGDARVAAVHGIVTLDGEPVGDASVTFMPKEGGRPAFGVTNADGTYELSTFETGDGALLGNHLVTITAVEEKVSSKAEALAEQHGSLSELMQPHRTPKQIWRIPQNYSDSDTSGLEFEVSRGVNNQADFPLNTKP